MEIQEFAELVRRGLKCLKLKNRLWIDNAKLHIQLTDGSLEVVKKGASFSLTIHDNEVGSERLVTSKDEREVIHCALMAVADARISDILYEEVFTCETVENAVLEVI